MLQCEYCDYYKKLQKYSDKKENTESICEFTGFIFTGDIHELDIEHPCSSVSYQTYLAKLKKVEPLVTFDEENWKINYKKHHVKSAEKKIRGIA